MNNRKGMIAMKIFKQILEIDICKYIYYNYFCKKIERKGTYKLYPYRGTKIELHKNSKVILNGNLRIGTHKVSGSKAETYCLLYESSILEINGEADIAYGSMIQAHTNSIIRIGQAHINSYSTIIADKSITVGNDNLISRYVVIFDSDFHPVFGEDGQRTNKPEAVILDDHVWIGVNATILRGSHIKSGAVIGANALITGDVKEKALMSAIPARGFGYIEWSSK